MILLIFILSININKSVKILDCYIKKIFSKIFIVFFPSMFSAWKLLWRNIMLHLSLYPFLLFQFFYTCFQIFFPFLLHSSSHTLSVATLASRVTQQNRVCKAKELVLRPWSTLWEFQASLFQTSFHLIPWTKYSLVAASNAVPGYNWKEWSSSSPGLLPWPLVNVGSWEVGFKSVVLMKTKELMQLHTVMNVWACTVWLLGRFLTHLSLGFVCILQHKLCILNHKDLKPLLRTGWKAIGFGIVKDHTRTLEGKERVPRPAFLSSVTLAADPATEISKELSDKSIRSLIISAWQGG